MLEVIRYICESCEGEHQNACAIDCEKFGAETCPECWNFYNGEFLCESCYDSR